jgi:hypothetical protein
MNSRRLSWLLFGIVASLFAGCGAHESASTSIDELQKARLSSVDGNGIAARGDDDADAPHEGGAHGSWGETWDGGAIAVGNASGPDGSVRVSSSSTSDGGRVVITSDLEDTGAPGSGHCIHGRIGGDGSYAVDAIPCHSEAQCRDRVSTTWDRCLRAGDARSVCGHKYGLGDIAHFDGISCETAASCDDGDEITFDFCARAENEVSSQ